MTLVDKWLISIAVLANLVIWPLNYYKLTNPKEVIPQGSRKDLGVVHLVAYDNMLCVELNENRRYYNHCWKTAVGHE